MDNEEYNEEYNDINETEHTGTEEPAQINAEETDEYPETENDGAETEDTVEFSAENQPEKAEETAPASQPVHEENSRVNTARQEENRTPENAPYYYSGYSGIPVYTEAPKKEKKKGRSFWIVATAVLTAICLITTSFAIGTIFGRNGASQNSNETEKQVVKVVTASSPDYVPAVQSTAEGKLDVPGVAAKVFPSVVVILSKSEEGTSLGTGIVFTEDGYIITCAHVIDDAVSVTVYLYGDDKTAHKAEVVGFDTYTDIGVIKVDLDGLTPAEFGESHKLVPGEQVVAIGTPYERALSYTVTEGIVSARRDNYNLDDLNLTLDLIQHSATINPGNSGGPLLNMYGQVVGINSVKIMSSDLTTTYEDIGFALQIETALPIIEQIINEGKVQRPQIGIKGATETTLGGVYVAEILKGGAAEKADIQVGDIITKLNGERVKSIEELIAKLGKCNIGDEVELTLLRDVDVIVTKVILQAPVDG